MAPRIWNLRLEFLSDSLTKRSKANSLVFPHQTCQKSGSSGVREDPQGPSLGSRNGLMPFVPVTVEGHGDSLCGICDQAPVTFAACFDPFDR